MADVKKEPLDGSDVSSGEESSTGSITASSSPEDNSTKDEGAQAFAAENEREDEGCIQSPIASAADDSEEEGAVHSPRDPAPHLTLTEDISEDALEAAPLPPKKPMDSRPLEPIEGELDFEDDTPADDPLQCGTEECLTKEHLGDSHQSKDDNLEEGEAEDDGEVSDVSGTELSPQDDDLEEGELQDGTASGSRKAQPRPICRFFNKGQCTWGTSCRFIHPGVNDRGNYNMFAPPPHPPKPPGGGGMPPIAPGAMMRGGAAMDLGPPLPPLPPPLPVDELPPVESAWERGLRHAKELMKRASRRKEQEPDFEDKRLNLGLLELDKENTDYYLSGGGTQCPQPLTSPPYLHERGDRGAGHRRYHTEADGFYGYEDPEQMDHGEREAREYWRGGRGYENFEVRWNRPELEHRERREKDRRFGRSYEGRDSTYGNYIPNQSRGDRQHSVDRERWREERFSEVQPSSRSRPDEWRDPWRRSKTPKGRQSRSRGRNRRSFSGCSSRSFSSRTSRSSYSYSRSSSSRSSYYSSERSYSRGGTRSQSRSHSRSRSPLAPPLASRFRNDAPHPPRYPPASQPPNNTSNKPARPTRVSPVLDRRKHQASPPVPAATPPARSTVHKKGPSDTSRQTKSRSGSYTGSSSGSRSRSSSSRTPSRSRSRSYSQSRSISIDSVSSASSSSGRRPGRGAAPVMARNPSPPKKSEAKKRPAPSAPVSSLPLDMDIPLPPIYRDPVPCVPEMVQCDSKGDSPRLKELVKQQQQLQQLQQQQIIQHKPQIKLTLIKKSLPLSMVKKEEAPAQKNGDKVSRKRTSPEKTPGPPSDESPPQGVRRSTTLRREELLKQLKAVEDAIARKRAKFS